MTRRIKHHHAGDGCTAAIKAAQKALAEQIQRVDDRLAALAELLPQRSTIEAGGIGFTAERAEPATYEARPQVDLRSAP